MSTISDAYKNNFLSSLSQVTDSIEKSPKKHAYLSFKKDVVGVSQLKSEAASFKKIVTISQQLQESNLLDDAEKASLKNSLKTLSDRVSNKNIPWYIIITLIGI